MNVLYFILPPYHTLSRAPTPLPLNLTLPAHTIEIFLELLSTKITLGTRAFK